MNRSSLLLWLVPMLLAGCARDSGRFPSLLPRAAETQSDLEPVRPVPPQVADPAIDAALAQTDAKLTAAASGFAAKVGDSEKAVAAAQGASVGSDAWLDAQRALGELDSARSETSAIAADLDRSAVDYARDHPRDYPAMTDLRARVDAELAQETAKIDALRSGLAKP